MFVQAAASSGCDKFCQAVSSSGTWIGICILTAQVWGREKVCQAATYMVFRQLPAQVVISFVRQFLVRYLGWYAHWEITQLHQGIVSNSQVWGLAAQIVAVRRFVRQLRTCVLFRQLQAQVVRSFVRQLQFPVQVTGLVCALGNVRQLQFLQVPGLVCAFGMGFSSSGLGL